MEAFFIYVKVICICKLSSLPGKSTLIHQILLNCRTNAILFQQKQLSIPIL